METRGVTRREFVAQLAAIQSGSKPGLRAEIGINIYSLRYLAEKDLPSTLRLVRQLGFSDVEAGDLYSRTPEEFRSLLDRAGLHATSAGVAYDALAGNIASVVSRAKTLGARHVVCATIPHSAKHLTAKDAEAAAQKLNLWGKSLAAEGLRLCYHTHGTEFDPSPDGTRFDTLARLSDPASVSFEMDIFWIVYGGQDPVQLLRRYPNRFPLMHVKDIRKGTVLGGSPADVREEESVPLGTGIVDVRAALLAAQDAGVEHLYLEDEAVDAVPQIRQSLRYLATLR